MKTKLLKKIRKKFIIFKVLNIENDDKGFFYKKWQKYYTLPFYHVIESNLDIISEQRFYQTKEECLDFIINYTVKKYQHLFNRKRTNIKIVWPNDQK